MTPRRPPAPAPGARAAHDRLAGRLAAALVASLVLAAAPACGVALTMMGKNASEPGTVGGPASSSACQTYQPEHWANGVQRSYDRDAGGYVFIAGSKADAELRDQVVMLSCVHRTRGTDAIVAHHLAFDDRRFDHLRAAVMVTDCALNEACDKTELGMMEWYARRMDDEAVATALARIDAPDEIRATFASRVKAARDVLATKLATLDPRRTEMYVTIPNAVRDERQAYFAAHAELFAKLDPLLDAAAEARRSLAVPAELPGALVALRDAYLRRCKGDGCRYDPFVYEVTRELVMLHVIGKDVGRALAEADWLHDEPMSAATYSEALLAAQLKATMAEADAFDKYRRAEQDGADPQALRAMFGDAPPVQVSRDSPAIVWGRRTEPDTTAALPRDGRGSAGGQVARVVPAGAWSKIVFADVVSTWEESDCVETNRVDYINPDGRIVYRKRCKGGKTHTERRKIEPVLVPREEASGLRPGESVAAIVIDGRGYVTSVRRKNTVVQVRSHRLNLQG